MQVPLEKLRLLMKELRELQKVSKRQRDTAFFEDYYTNYEKYQTYYMRACKLLKEKKIETLELEIPKLSANEIEILTEKGKHNTVLGNYLIETSEYSSKLASFIQNVITFHRNISRAEAYLKDAYNEKNRASTLLRASDWNGSVEASQHSIEHCIKSLFRLVGLAHPISHDPTKEFEDVVEKLELSSWELKNVARIRWLAKVWATIHEESMYAFRDIAAKEFFNEKDAEVLIDYANEVYSVCNVLTNKVKFGQVDISIV